MGAEIGRKKCREQNNISCHSVSQSEILRKGGLVLLRMLAEIHDRAKSCGKMRKERERKDTRVTTHTEKAFSDQMADR